MRISGFVVYNYAVSTPGISQSGNFSYKTYRLPSIYNTLHFNLQSKLIRLKYIKVISLN
jgi:hypothetical protein